MVEEKKIVSINPDLLEILRDPLAVQDKEKYGADPGRLELVHNCWLVSKDTGLKYPISEGIPVMLIEEGMKWKDVAVADLPVPPPPLGATSPAPVEDEETSMLKAGCETDMFPGTLVYIIAGVLTFVLVVMLLRGRRKVCHEQVEVTDN
ncbi:MAG: hypothetical protein JW981_10130 [Anaerolineae bacterium]|nr:hypothetical protein [Anaerolineae bacterium]